MSSRDVTSDRRIRAQTSRAALDNLLALVKTPYVKYPFDVTGAQLSWWPLDDDRARQVIDVLREEMAHLRGGQDRIGEQVIDHRQTGAGRVAPRGHLDRSGLACKCAESIADLVSGKVDQNIDPVGPNAICQLIIGPLQNASPPIGSISEGARHGVLDWRAGIANDLESRLVVVLQHRPD
jgi:hypothetical protein